MGVGPPALLVPELCYMTGITDDMRSNFNVMKDLIQKTRISPEERLAHVVKFATRIYGNQEAMALLHKWGLRLDTTSVDVDGRVLGQPEIRFNDRMAKLAPNDNDFTRTVTSNPCFRPVDLKRWTILVAAKDRALAATFDRTYGEVSRTFGIRYSPPDIQMVKGNGNYITGKDIRKHIQDNVQLHDTQFLVIIMSQQRDEPYAATKQELLVANSIPSQVILAKTLSNDRKLRSIVQKIALQINCKLGGANWALQIRVPGQIMFVGIDTYHDPKRKDKSVLAMVGTLDNECTKFYSTVALQTPHQEFGDSLGVLFTKVLNAYVATNHQLPARVVVFRDGIGDGQHDLVINHEVPAMKEALECMPDDEEGKVIANTKFTFIITQKRINERLFVKPMGGASLKNPIPGTIVDQTITRKGKYDFFLVSQNVTQGTVTPTHYHVVEDCGEYKPDMIQKMAYFLTYMYFNWPGSIRVPAVCQYAHKLAYLVGQHLKNMPKEENSWKLYYL
jgi:aubergine-like protein